MTKSVVSVALLMVYEEGRFQLDDPLERHLPEFHGLMVRQYPYDARLLAEFQTLVYRALAGE